MRGCVRAARQIPGAAKILLLRALMLLISLFAASIAMRSAPNLCRWLILLHVPTLLAIVRVRLLRKG